MASRISKFVRALYRTGGAALAILALGCVTPIPGGAAVGSGPPSPAAARIWIYRDYQPFQTLARPYVRLNSAITAISEPGGAFYRDVPPGQYLITVDTYGEDFYQFATVALRAGETVYIKVESLRGWASGGGDHGTDYERDTFYTRIIPPEIAQAEIARTPFYGGG